MKLLLFIILSLLFAGWRLPENSGDCGILLQAISSEYAQKEFFLCKDTTKFILFDKERCFENCNQLNVCGKEIKISHDDKYDKINTNNFPSEGDKSIIILYRIEILKKDYSLYFWRPYSGAVLILTYRRSCRSYKLVDYKVGAF